MNEPTAAEDWPLATTPTLKPRSHAAGSRLSVVIQYVEARSQSGLWTLRLRRVWHGANPFKPEQV